MGLGAILWASYLMANQYNGRKDARTRNSGEMLQTFLSCAEPWKSCALVSSKSSLVSEAQLRSHGHGPWTTTSTLTSVLELDLDIRSRTDYLVKFTLLD